MDKSRPEPARRQYSLAALLGAVAAFAAVLGIVYWLQAHPLWLVPTILAAGLIICGIALRLRRLTDWGVIILVGEVLVALFMPASDSVARRSPRRDKCRDNLG